MNWPPNKIDYLVLNFSGERVFPATLSAKMIRRSGDLRGRDSRTRTAYVASFPSIHPSPSINPIALHMYRVSPLGRRLIIHRSS